MSNKYLLKLAAIIDVDPEGNVVRIHSDPDLEHRANKAKLINPSQNRANKFLRRVVVPASSRR